MPRRALGQRLIAHIRRTADGRAIELAEVRPSGLGYAIARLAS